MATRFWPPSAHGKDLALNIEHRATYGNMGKSLNNKSPMSTWKSQGFRESSTMKKPSSHTGMKPHQTLWRGGSILDMLMIHILQHCCWSRAFVSSIIFLSYWRVTGDYYKNQIWHISGTLSQGAGCETKRWPLAIVNRNVNRHFQPPGYMTKDQICGHLHFRIVLQN